MKTVRTWCGRAVGSPGLRVKVRVGEGVGEKGRVGGDGGEIGRKAGTRLIHHLSYSR